MPHCRCISDEDLQWFYASFTSRWEVLCHHQPHCLHRPTVWDLFHFPLVALPVPPRYTFPNSSLDSCLAQTLNVVHASLAMPPLRNLHLRHNQMAAARSWVDPNHGSLIRHTAQGSRTFLSHVNLSSAVIFGGDLEPDSGNAPGC